MYIISGCLLGHNCKYNGGSNRCEAVLEFCRTHKYVTVCPESAAQLPKPRPPAERVGMCDAAAFDFGLSGRSDLSDQEKR